MSYFYPIRPSTSKWKRLGPRVQIFLTVICYATKKCYECFYARQRATHIETSQLIWNTKSKIVCKNDLEPTFLFVEIFQKSCKRMVWESIYLSISTVCWAIYLQSKNTLLIDPVHTITGFFYTPWNHQETCFSNVFRGYKKSQVAWNGSRCPVNTSAKNIRWDIDNNRSKSNQKRTKMK